MNNENTQEAQQLKYQIKPTASIPVSTSLNANMVNVLNKYGTVAGYSMTSKRPIIINKTHTNYFDSGVVGQSNQAESNTTSLASTTNNNVSSAAEAAAQALANSRLRAINRSFRTAVDKSFDMPTNSGKWNAFEFYLN
jgi:hypothetical protein